MLGKAWHSFVAHAKRGRYDLARSRWPDHKTIRLELSTAVEAPWCTERLARRVRRFMLTGSGEPDGAAVVLPVACLLGSVLPPLCGAYGVTGRGP